VVEKRPPYLKYEDSILFMDQRKTGIYTTTQYKPHNQINHIHRKKRKKKSMDMDIIMDIMDIMG